jgi:hypothetical protein
MTLGVESSGPIPPLEAAQESSQHLGQGLEDVGFHSINGSSIRITGSSLPPHQNSETFRRRLITKQAESYTRDIVAFLCLILIGLVIFGICGDMAGKSSDRQGKIMLCIAAAGGAAAVLIGLMFLIWNVVDLVKLLTPPPRPAQQVVGR